VVPGVPVRCVRRLFSFACRVRASPAAIYYCPIPIHYLLPPERSAWPEPSNLSALFAQVYQLATAGADLSQLQGTEIYELEAVDSAFSMPHRGAELNCHWALRELYL